MDLVAAEIFSAILVFGVLIGCSFIPYVLVTCTRRNESSKEYELTATRRRCSNVPILSFCNCFSAGVFIATCFLGLVPHVRQHVAMYEGVAMKNRQHNASGEQESMSAHGKKQTPFTELLLVGGFLLMLLIEELIRTCQSCECRGRGKHSKLSGVSVSASHKRKSLPNLEDEPLIRATETSGDDGECLDKVDLQELNLSPIKTKTNGDCHHHHDASSILKDGHTLSWRSVALLLGLGIHGAFEGVALGLQDNVESLFSLLFGVMTHEVLCAVAFGINLGGHNVKAGVGFLTVVLFSVSIPLGMAGGFVVRVRQGASGGRLVVRIVLEGLAAGTFVYVAFIDMLNHELANDKCRLAKVICVCFGFLLFFCLTLI